MNSKLIKRIEEIFYIKLQEKTSWGRNDLKKVYQQAIKEALLELID